VWQKGDIHVAATKFIRTVGTGQAGASARPAKDRFSEQQADIVCNELSANLNGRTSWRHEACRTARSGKVFRELQTGDLVELVNPLGGTVVHLANVIIGVYPEAAYNVNVLYVAGATSVYVSKVPPGGIRDSRNKCRILEQVVGDLSLTVVDHLLLFLFLLCNSNTLMWHYFVSCSVAILQNRKPLPDVLFNSVPTYFVNVHTSPCLNNVGAFCYSLQPMCQGYSPYLPYSCFFKHLCCFKSVEPEVMMSSTKNICDIFFSCASYFFLSKKASLTFSPLLFEISRLVYEYFSFL